jgi:hypothetical protein
VCALLFEDFVSLLCSNENRVARFEKKKKRCFVALMILASVRMTDLFMVMN